MERVPKVAAGTYDGEQFIVLDRVIHMDGDEYIKIVEAYVIEFFDGSKKYVLDYDPLLKFDPIRMEDTI